MARDRRTGRCRVGEMNDRELIVAGRRYLTGPLRDRRHGIGLRYSARALRAYAIRAPINGGFACWELPTFLLSVVNFSLTKDFLLESAFSAMFTLECLSEKNFRDECNDREHAAGAFARADRISR